MPTGSATTSNSSPTWNAPQTAATESRVLYVAPILVFPVLAQWIVISAPLWTQRLLLADNFRAPMAAATRLAQSSPNLLASAPEALSCGTSLIILVPLRDFQPSGLGSCPILR